MSLRQLAHASGMLSLSVADVVERYSDVFARQDLRIPALGELADRVFTRFDSDLLRVASSVTSHGHPFSFSWTCPAPLLDTAITVREADASTEKVIERIEELSALGLLANEAPALVESWRAISFSDWDLFPKDLARRIVEHGHDSDTADGSVASDGLHPAHAFSIAAYAGLSVGEVCTRVHRLGTLLGVDLSSALPPEIFAADARPDERDVEACCHTSQRDFRWAQPTIEALVTHARADDRTLGDSIEVLSRYASLGAPWAEPDDTSGNGSWRDHRPTPHDSALFKEDLVGDLRAGPLELVRVAARFGWRITDAWDRLALYRPFGFALDVERPEFEAVPVWQDLILLTERYTGSAPALTGQVTPERIAVAARELQRSTRWIHDRLSLYAALFGLEMPQKCPAEPASMPAPEYYRPDAVAE